MKKSKLKRIYHKKTNDIIKSTFSSKEWIDEKSLSSYVDGQTSRVLSGTIYTHKKIDFDVDIKL